MNKKLTDIHNVLARGEKIGIRLNEGWVGTYTKPLIAVTVYKSDRVMSTLKQIFLRNDIITTNTERIFIEK